MRRKGEVDSLGVEFHLMVVEKASVKAGKRETTESKRVADGFERAEAEKLALPLIDGSKVRIVPIMGVGVCELMRRGLISGGVSFQTES
ncbi:unnamed protein product [Linum trigynum]|uniref:Uncharacterized protein n=1 Tax=Linum trigynum TaxID=586398 RepID=A0AAV2EKH6_9ROSI